MAKKKKKKKNAFDIKNSNPVTLKEIVRRINHYIFEKWQEEWMSSNKGRITFAFFPSVAERFKAKKLEINYFTTQVLSGHGNFAEYLRRFEVAESDVRLDCNAGKTDNVHHLIFECSKWKDLREKYSIDESFYNFFITFVSTVMPMKYKY